MNKEDFQGFDGSRKNAEIIGKSILEEFKKKNVKIEDGIYALLGILAGFLALLEDDLKNEFIFLLGAMTEEHKEYLKSNPEYIKDAVQRYLKDKK